MPGLINGNYISFVDVTLTLDAFQIAAFKSLTYSEKLGRNYVRGTSPLPLGFTTGKYEAKFEIELFLPSVGLITSIPGWKQIPHVATVAYGPNAVAPLPFSIDTIAAIYFTDLDAPNSDSEDGITRKLSGMVMLPILWNGVPSIIWPATLGAVG